MERALRVILRLQIALLNLMLVAACQPRFSPDAARALEGRIVLLKPSRDGLQPVSVSRQPLPSINLPTRKAVAFSPDFGAYIDTSVRSGVYTLTLVRGSSSRVIVSEPFEPKRSAQPAQIRWNKVDGAEFAVLIDGRLMIFRENGANVDRLYSIEGVRSFAVSNNVLYVVRRDAPRVIEDIQSGRRIEAEEDLNELFLSPYANELLGTTAEKLVLSVVSTETGKMRKISLRNVEGELRDVSPVGKGQVLVETWDGDERVDGTERSTFSLCTLDGLCSFAFKDDEHVRIHRLPPTYQPDGATAVGNTRSLAPVTP